MRSNVRYFSILTHSVMVSGEQAPGKTAEWDPEEMREKLKAFFEKTGFRITEGRGSNCFACSTVPEMVEYQGRIDRPRSRRFADLGGDRFRWFLSNPVQRPANEPKEADSWKQGKDK